MPLSRDVDRVRILRRPAMAVNRGKCLARAELFPNRTGTLSQVTYEPLSIPSAKCAELIEMNHLESDGRRVMFARSTVAVTLTLSSTLLCLSGCGGGGNNGNYGPMTTNSPPATMHGVVQGGQKGAKAAAVTLYSVGTTGYGSPPTQLGAATTDDSGAWTITFTMPQGDPLVYVVANGGDVGNGQNGAIALMTAIGPLSSAPSSVLVNEVTTVASVYSLAQFLNPSSATAVGAPASNAVGLSNAFGTVLNLVSLGTGVALTSSDAFTPIVNSVTNASEAPPGPLVNTLAELLSGCIVSSQASSGCSSLFTLAKPSAEAQMPTNTRQAILDVALHPANSVSELFALSRNGGVAFQPDLRNAAPNDFTMAINFIGGALLGAQPVGVAIDAAGNAWVTNDMCHCVIELHPHGSQSGPFTSSGTPGLDFRAPGGAIAIGANPATEGELAWTVSTFGQDLHALDTHSDAFLFGGDGLARFMTPQSVATDTVGNVWVADVRPQILVDGSTLSKVLEISPGPMNDYSVTTEFDLAQTVAMFPPSNFGFIALDGDSPANIWLSDVTENRIVEFRGRTPGIQSNFQSFPLPAASQIPPGPLAVDPSGNVWVVDVGAQELIKNATGFTPTNFPDNTIFSPGGLAVDSAGNVWVTNSDTNGNKGVVELGPNGTVISVPNGAFNGGSPSATGGPLGLTILASFPQGIAIDSSGNLWIAVQNTGISGSVVELVGGASPVKTPNNGPPVLP
jgi:streptogramin lyase